MANVDAALSQLQRFGSTEEALALLEMLEAKKRKEEFLSLIHI